MWMRRAAAVSLIIPAKEGKFLEEAFEISDILMADKEDLVQKGYGWLLKVESRGSKEATREDEIRRRMRGFNHDTQQDKGPIRRRGIFRIDRQAEWKPRQKQGKGQPGQEILRG